MQCTWNETHTEYQFDLSANNKEQRAKPAPMKNTKLGEVNHTIPKRAGITTAAI